LGVGEIEHAHDQRVRVRAHPAHELALDLQRRRAVGLALLDAGEAAPDLHDVLPGRHRPSVRCEPMNDFDVLLDTVEIRGRTVVDIGCGDGALVRKLITAGANAIGVDVEIGRALAVDPAGRYLEGGAERIPLPDASVDVAVFMRSLHHVPDPYAAFPELRRVV